MSMDLRYLTVKQFRFELKKATNSYPFCEIPVNFGNYQRNSNRIRQLTASLKGRTAIGKKIGDWRWIRMIGERRF
jgi:hypothetical protein